MLRLKVAGLVPVPDKASVFGDRGLGFKAVNIANFSNDTSGVDLANAGNGCQGIGDNLELLLNGLVQNLDLFLQRSHRGDGYGHGLVHGIIYRFGQAIRRSGRSLYRFGGSIWVCKSATACFRNKGSQFIQISVCQVIHSFKTLHERNGGGTGILDVLVLGHTGAFEK